MRESTSALPRREAGPRFYAAWQFVAMLAIGFLAALVLASAWRLITWQIGHSTIVPFGDMISSLTKLQAFLNLELGLRGYFLDPNNEHIIATSRLVFLLDWYVAKGTGLLTVAVSYLIAVLVAASMCAFLYLATPRLPSLLRLALMLGILLLWFNGNQLMNLNWGFQVQHWFASGLAWSAAAIFAAVESSERTERRLAGLGCLVMACLAAVLSLGNGVIFLPVLVVLALIDRWPMRDTALLVLAVILGFALYLAITALKPAHGITWGLSTLTFTLLYLGGAFIRLLAWPANMEAWPDLAGVGYGFGAGILLVAAIAALLRLRHPRAGGPLVTAGLALIAIATATGLLAALSRESLGMAEAANKKYTTFATLGWCGTLFIVTGFLNSRLRARYFLAATIGAALTLAVLAAFIRVTEQNEYLIFEKWNNRLAESSLSLRFRARDDEYDNTIHYDLPRLRALAADLLEPRHAGFYASRLPAAGATLQPNIRDLGCFGGVEAITPVVSRAGAATSGATRFQGWAWIRDRRRPPSLVAIIDADDRVRGLATMTRAAPVADEVVFARISQQLYAGFFGFFVANGRNPYRIIALDRDTDDACQLGQFER